ncbi:DUF4134 domain-containing protein [Maribacter polysaccharolyticus]|uniref:DUF4134 domain-containing protein n=1 Tax=Maribacter polysaccharolyticus TaxID=3020831 RepID=UPI00237F7116|nr:DUF4134 domain-containing protein [Maribacter polysaccharolyticus]MDE3744044.1 DUF4134 domain-containing protein [Maribacter polysaccharolyticus]
MRTNNLKTRKNYLKKRILFGFALFAFAMGQAQGLEGINAADAEIRTYVESVGNLILAIGAVVGLIGAIRVYIAWNNGDQDVTKKIMGWLGACLFLVLSGAVINAFFGV